ncbi:hypothetical protein QYE76_066335 [Lolium multiflorum]|uniref:Uncharacterized protein n=1 Tax=Lolium multiflorum TaxID=4521 RepID=A0AAD8WAQ1_LOLMU|nr:hypothetical protein QYE76_066335 [Lolium multiflorum]
MTKENSVDGGSRNHTILAPHIAIPFLAPSAEADDGSRQAQDLTAAATTIHRRRPWRRSRRRTSRDAALDAEHAAAGGPAATVASTDGSGGGRETEGGRRKEGGRSPRWRPGTLETLGEMCSPLQDERGVMEYRINGIDGNALIQGSQGVYAAFIARRSAFTVGSRARGRGAAHENASEMDIAGTGAAFTVSRSACRHRRLLRLLLPPREKRWRRQE